MELFAVTWNEKRTLKWAKAKLGLGAMRKARIVPMGETGLCYHNCDRYVAQHGGTILYGWLALKMPDKFMVLEHHAIVRSETGEFIDPTDFPTAAGQETILFQDNRVVPDRDYPPAMHNLFLSFEGGEDALQAYRRGDEAQLAAKRKYIAEARRQGVAWISGRGPVGIEPTPDVQAIREEIRAAVELRDRLARALG